MNKVDYCRFQRDLERNQVTNDYISSIATLTFEICQSTEKTKREGQRSLARVAFSHCLDGKQFIKEIILKLQSNDNDYIIKVFLRVV